MSIQTQWLAKLLVCIGCALLARFCIIGFECLCCCGSMGYTIDSNQIGFHSFMPLLIVDKTQKGLRCIMKAEKL